MNLPEGRGETTYRLARQHAGIGHFAEVTVRVTDSASGFALRISPLVFDWLHEVYGPDAWEWAVCDEFRGGAVRGVANALQHTRTAVNWQLAIEALRIRARPPTPSLMMWPSPHASRSGRPAAWSPRRPLGWRVGGPALTQPLEV